MLPKEGVIVNLPNKLTIFRIFLIPVIMIVYSISNWRMNSFIFPNLSVANFVVLLLIFIGALTDFLDGHIARKYNLVTNFGKFMDPLADKLLVCSAMIALVGMHRLSSIVAIIIIAREFIISGFRLIASDNGIVIAASYWGKFKTNFQMFMIIMLIIDLGTSTAVMIENILIVIATALTIISLVDYLVKNKQVLSEGN